MMLRQLEQILYIKDIVKSLRRNPYLRRVCGYGDRTPTEAHFSQMKKRVGVEGFRVVEAWLRREALRLRESQPLTAVGLVQAACFDGTALPASSRQTGSGRPPVKYKLEELSLIKRDERTKSLKGFVMLLSGMAKRFLKLAIKLIVPDEAPQGDLPEWAGRVRRDRGIRHLLRGEIGARER